MCVALPWRVVSIDQGQARIVVEAGAVRRPALCLDLPDLEVGDAVILAGSVAVRRLSGDQASAIERLLLRPDER